MQSIPKPLVLVALPLFLLAAQVRADETSEKGRAILDKYQHAVVTVEIVLKASRSGRSNEAREDITGTVVDPSGLTVVALSACDPAEIYRRLSDSYSMETEITDVKILLEDDTELPAEIVLRDKDLDLAFIRPKSKPANPMTAVDLGKSSPARALDEVITLNRLNRAAGRAYGASVERITAVVQKPRTFYLPDSTMTATALGSPVFALDGNMVGMVVMRAISGNARDGLASIILPAEDILKGARQAPVAKVGEKKDESKPESEAKPEEKKPESKPPQ